MCRPGGGSAIRTVMAIAERMPEVGRQFYENVLAKTINRLADYLQAHVGPDDLAIEDCGLAAAQFMQMCQATLFLPFVFQAEPAPSAERIAQVVDSATRMFLADVSGEASVRPADAVAVEQRDPGNSQLNAATQSSVMR